MKSVKNNHVNKELERLLEPLRNSKSAQYDIIAALFDEVYTNDDISRPESLSKDIENKLYRLIDEHVKYNLQKDDH